MTAIVATETVVIILLAVLVAGLLRSHAQILRALHELGVDIDGERDTVAGGAIETPVRLGPSPESAPSRGRRASAYNVTGTTPAGEALSIAVVGARADTLLAFLSSGCVTCANFWNAFRDGADLSLPDAVRLVVVTLGPGEESPARMAKLAPADVPVVMSSETWADYRVPGSPYFVLVRGATGEITGEGSAPTWPEVLSLLGDAVPESRADRADRDLEAAGILPGDPRLHPMPQDERSRVIVTAGIVTALLAAVRSSWSP